jgi:hypothetical protein
MNPSAYGWKKQYFIQQQPIFIGALLQIVQNELIKPYTYISIVPLLNTVRTHQASSQE